MKRFLSITLFAAALSLFSVTAAFAVDCPPNSGCPCEVAEAMENHANAMKVRDKAITREIVKQNDNSIGMTCFDNAMLLSSRLGLIFSDIPTTGVFPKANTRVFGAVYDAAFGTGFNPDTGRVKTLYNAYTHVVVPMMQENATDFNDSLSFWLGATALNALSNSFGQAIDALVAPLNALITSIMGVINTIDTWMDNLITALDIINTIMPSLVPGAINAINTLYWPMIKNTLLTAIQTVQTNIINTIVNAITALVSGVATSLLGVDPLTGVSRNDPNEGECARISRLWDPGVQALIADFRPVEGGGVENGTPYGTFMDLLQALAPGAGSDMMDEIQNAANSPILTAALNDLTGAGVLAGPGNMPSWPPSIPAFPVIGGAAMSAIRGAM